MTNKVYLKDIQLITSDDVPTKTSDLANDSNFVSDASYVHTDNNYTSTEKSKLSGIASGAEVNVQADWNVTSTASDAFIKNKPTIPSKTSDLANDSGFITSSAVPTKTSDLTNDSNFVVDANYVHTDSNYTSAEKTKLSGIASGAEVNVQSDWSVTTTTSDAYIKNKPNLATVATSGAYSDLSGKPTIPTATSDLTNDSNFVVDANYVHTDSNYTSTEKSKLSGIAAGAEVNVQADWNVTSTTSDAFIKNKPTIPTKTSDLQNDSNFVSDASYVHTDTNYTSADATKLSGIASGAEVNQNAFTTVKVGTTNLVADSKTDTLTITAGSNVTLTPTASSDSFTIAATDTTYSNASPLAAGLMSSTDKVKLDDINIPTFTVQSVTVSSTTKGANFSQDVNISAFPSGWTASDPRNPYVTSFYWSNGTRQNWFNCYGLFTELVDGDWIIHVRFCNMHTSSAANGTLQVILLWI